jgi:hypothetical protein
MGSLHPTYEDTYTEQYAEQYNEHLRHRRQLELRRQEEYSQRLALREQRAREERDQRKKRHAKRAKILSRYIKAAIVIQRSFRRIRHARKMTRLDRAASIVTKSVRAFPKIRQAKFISKKLEKIQELRERIASSKQIFERSCGGSDSAKQWQKARLQLEDDLVKIQLEADRIMTDGNESLRSHRKQLIREAQIQLTRLDNLPSLNADSSSEDDFAEAMDIFNET